MVIFANLWILWLLPIPIILLFFIKQQKFSENLFSPRVLAKITVGNYGLSAPFRQKLILLAIIFSIIALAQPQLEQQEVEIKTTTSDIIIAIDMSKSMSADDIYPSRFDFIKNKFLKSLDSLTAKRLAVIGFSSQSFLISPLTADLQTLKFLLKNISLDNQNLVGTSILGVLETGVKLSMKNKNPQILILTDGGDKKDWQQEINYAKKHNIQVYIYDASTKNGSTLAGDDGFLKDANNNIVIVKENLSIIDLATKSAGSYLKYSLKGSDLENFIQSIKNNNSTHSQSKIKQNIQLFYYFLALSLLLSFVAFFSLPKFLSK